MVKELPRELWLEIFKHFIVSFGFTELYKYRKVCKVWCELIIVILIDKLMNMVTRIKYYYRVISNMEEPKINLFPFPFSSTFPIKTKTESNKDNDDEHDILSSSSSQQEEMKSFISYNYKTESFEYNFITIIKFEDDDIKNGFCKMFCLMIHFIHKILNFNLIKILRNNSTEHYWLNIEEIINDDDTKFFQKITVRGDKLLPYIDQIHVLIDYLNNLTAQ